MSIIKFSEWNGMRPPEPATPQRTSGLRFGLRLKLFLVILISFSLLLASMVIQVNVEANRAAQQEVERSLERSQMILKSRLDSRFSVIERLARNIAGDSRLAPNVSEKNQRALGDLSQELQKPLDYDFVIITDAQGKILERSDDKMQVGTPVKSNLIFESALKGATTSGFLRRDSCIFQIVAAPVFDIDSPDVVRGSVGLAYRLDLALADEIKNLTASDITFFSVGLKPDSMGRQNPSVQYSTLGPRSKALSEYMRDNPSVWQSVVRERETKQFEGRIAGETYVSLLYPFIASDGTPIGFAVAQRSRSELLVPFLTIENRVLLMGAICFTLAALAAYFLAQAVSATIVQLVSVTRGIQEGRYPESVPNTRNDELGMLQMAIYRMSQALKERDELEDFLASFDPKFSETAEDASIEIGLPKRKQPTITETPELWFAPGTVFDSRFKIQNLLGTGAAGVVYRAEDMQLDEEVALKIIPQRLLTPVGEEQLKREVKLARRISHKNTVRTHDVGNYGNCAYISMEYVEGYTLERMIDKRGAFDLKRGLLVAKQICSAMAESHDQGVIHRDLKPGNMMITHQGVLKIMDFGIALSTAGINPSVTAKQVDSPETPKDALFGTPAFMSPEQIRGEDLDGRSDIYSIGVILFYIFCGKLPYPAETTQQMVAQHLFSEPRSLRAFNPNIPKTLEQIIFRAMQKDRQNRFRNVRELGAALAELLDSHERPAIQSW